MKQAVVGILAHVDAGKTTLSEAMLYRSGEIRSLGRVDHGDAFLDTDDMEKRRGITIFSKQAIVEHGGLRINLLDTPGHVDFSAEMERTLRVLDYAILVVSGPDGVQGYTETLWRLLERYRVPTFVFVNKMDAVGADHDALLARLQRRFGEGCVDFGVEPGPGEREDVALLDEAAMDDYLDGGMVGDDRLRSMIAARRLFPCYFGSALKLDGVDGLLDGLERYTRRIEYPERFGARVFNISHDRQGNRLTWLKVTGGRLPVKSWLTNGDDAQPDNVAAATGQGAWREKADQLRVYSGAKFTLTDMARAGDICAVTGLTRTFPGEGLGCEPDAGEPVLEPVLTYTVLPGDHDPHKALVALRELGDEDPLLHVAWDGRLQEIRVQLMGAVQLEIVQQMMHDRFGLDVRFGPGGILYKETIVAPVEGVGHFEPLRHYAEAHILLEPTREGSGLSFATDCDEDVLDRNWQRLILTHLREKEHLGVLTGSPITDMRLTLVNGRAHLKHTEGGDFRQATYRAVRQGLMRARERGDCRLLEPWYRFRLETPQDMLGRAMADVQRMSGDFGQPRTDGERAVLEGTAPVSEMRDYAMDVNAYTHGQGHIVCTFGGYHPCHNAETVIEQAAYDPESDLENTPDSVFCAHGAGYPVSWDDVESHMHLPLREKR
ncbi:GTP-binding protein [Bifidobacterium catulorum]|uniref:GTP-binding protein n=1 Tax=Bifidobacterium catulorum TaxID=1630173 RepID=A0A2U2MR37_9BIFI|nr:TetM/TetW/TetO/TetS family tetracycline resistance ribosomal protection protein [Bifidobacterium catulorum]PWG59310.1 GTP-binding protein [Bifidobacterium catulorum]